MFYEKIIVINLDEVLYGTEVIYNSEQKAYKYINVTNMSKIIEAKRCDYILVIGIQKENSEEYILGNFDKIYNYEDNLIEVIQEAYETYYRNTNQMIYIGLSDIDQIANRYSITCYTLSKVMENTKKDGKIIDIDGKVENNFLSKVLDSILGTNKKEENKSNILDKAKEHLKANIRKSTYLYEILMPIINYKDVNYAEWKKKKIKGGNLNPDKIFYIMRIEDVAVGPISSLEFYFTQIDYAHSKNYIPIIDLKNYFLPMWQDWDEKGKKNAYENYFITQYDLKEVYNSRNIILGWQAGHGMQSVKWDINLLNNSRILNKYCNIAKTFLKFNDYMSQYIDETYKNVFPLYGKVLGIECRRGLECANLRNDSIIPGHPRQSSCENMILYAKKYMQEWDCKYLFVMSDDREFLDIMMETFPKQVVFMNRKRKHYFKNSVPVLNCAEVEIEFLSSKEETVLQRNRDYFTEIAMLAKCNCLVSSVSSASIMARILNGDGYEHVKVIDNGVY